MSNTAIFSKTFSNDTLLKKAQDLVVFSALSFNHNPDAAIHDGLVFALEMQASQLGLADDEMHDDPGYDSAIMMEQYTDALAACAEEANLPGWARIEHHLPYGSKSKLRISEGSSTPTIQPYSAGDTPVAISSLKVADLDRDTLQNSVNELLQFIDFTFFDERDIAVRDGVTFAIAIQAIGLGLISGNEHVNSTLIAYFDALTACANELHIRGWAMILDEMTSLTVA